jgi:hypothetical protein
VTTSLARGVRAQAQNSLAAFLVWQTCQASRWTDIKPAQILFTLDVCTVDTAAQSALWQAPIATGYAGRALTPGSRRLEPGDTPLKPPSEPVMGFVL